MTKGQQQAMQSQTEVNTMVPSGIMDEIVVIYAQHAVSNVRAVLNRLEGMDPNSEAYKVVKDLMSSVQFDAHVACQHGWEPTH